MTLSFVLLEFAFSEDFVTSEIVHQLKTGFYQLTVFHFEVTNSGYVVVVFNACLNAPLL